MNKLILSLTLICLIVLFTAFACVNGHDANGISQGGTSQADVNANLFLEKGAADVTATFGAEQFYLQLTAVAEQEP